MSSSNREIWDNVAKNYTTNIEPYDIQLAQEIMSVFYSMNIKPGSKLLELGSGSGHLSAYLAMQGYTVTLLDYSPIAVAKSKELFQKNDLKGDIIQGDLFEIDSEDMDYDLIWNSGVIEHFDNEKLLEFFRKVTSFNCNSFAFIVPNPECVSYLMMRYNLMSKNKWIYGTEYLRNDYENIAQKAGLIIKDKFYIAKEFTKAQFSSINLNTVHNDIYYSLMDNGLLPKKERYLTVYFMQRENYCDSANLPTADNSDVCIKTKIFDLTAEKFGIVQINKELHNENQQLKINIAQKENNIELITLENQNLKNDIKQKNDELELGRVKYEKFSTEIKAKIEENKKLSDINLDLKSKLKNLEDENYELSCRIMNASNTIDEYMTFNTFKFIHFYFRFKYQFVKGNLNEKKNFIHWFSNKIFKKVNPPCEAYNPIIKLKNVLTTKINFKLDNSKTQTDDINISEDMQSAIIDLRNGSYKHVYIFSSLGLGWNIPMQQRTNHFANELIRRGELVFFAANPSVIGDANVKTIVKQSKSLYLVNFSDRSIKSKIIEIIFNNTKAPIVYELIGTDFGNTIEDIRNIKERGGIIFYEYIDEISPDIIPGIPDYVIKRHEKILSDMSNIVFVTSDKLSQNILKYRKENYTISYNGVNLKDWIIEDHDYLPDDMKNIVDNKKPIVGYYGAFAQWVDYELLKKLATKRDYNIVLIGATYDNSLKDSGLLKYENVYFLGSKNYYTLKYYSKYFNVCMIPFRIYDVTLSTSPVKLFEYMAQKKAIVSTDIPECRKYKSCFIGTDHDDFINKVDYAIKIANDGNIQEELYKEAEKNTWSIRVDEFLKVLDKKLSLKDGKLLTIVVPTYNMEQYLDRCLSSFEISNKMDLLDILVIDDGSKDNSVCVAKKYIDKYPDIYRLVSKENGGHGSAINVGLQNAKGRFFKVVDADDWLDKSSLINHLVYLLECADNMIITNYCRCHIDGIKETVKYEREFSNLQSKKNVQLKTILKYLDPNSFTGYFHMHSITYRTEILKRSGLKCSEKCFYVDQEYISIPMDYVTSISYQNIELYQYFIGRNDQSVSAEGMKKRLPDHEKVLRRLIENYNMTHDEDVKKYLKIITEHHARTHLFYMNEIGLPESQINNIKSLLKDINLENL